MGPSKASNGSANVSISPGVEQIIFLRREDGAVSKENMQLAYDAHVRAYPDVSAVWHNADQYSCDTIDTSRKVFVCEKFKGTVFNNLKKNKARIFGPQFLLDRCEKELRITTKQNLIFSATMAGICVCCTNISSELRKDLQSKVQLMGGVSSKAFTKDVTHLVAGEVGSKKYHVACNSKVPVMVPDWIEECWKLTQNDTFHAADNRFKNFVCPIFKGLTITVSQIDFSERKEIQGLIEKNGGIYSGDLKVGDTTHVILSQMIGAKFKVAQKNQIFCVKPSWVYDSFAKGFCIDENLYTLGDCVANVPSASTPAKPDETAFKDLSCASSILSKTVNETVATNASIANDLDKNMENVLQQQSVLQDQTILRKLEMCKQTSGAFLDGCKIMLSGFSPTVTEKLRKILNAGGATRFNQLTDNVSHVILGDKVDENYKSLLEGKHRPQIVNINWLIESMNSGKPVDEADFHCLKIEEITTMASPFSKPSRKASDSTNQPNYSSFTAGVSSKTDELDDEVMNQYVSGVQDDTEKIFQGSFLILGFEEEYEEYLKSLIAENGGILETCDDSTVDFAVVPINGYSSNVHAQATVTDFWVQLCIEADRFQDVSSHPLFTPIAINLTREPLSGCVFSLSQYSGSERQCLVNIIELLGARFQEYLSRQNSEARGLLASTHLIAKNPEGSKYMGALNWGIPVVNFQWLLACASENEKVDENDFIIRNVGVINTTHKQSSLCSNSSNRHLEQQLNKSVEKVTGPELNSVGESYHLTKSKVPADGQRTPLLNKISYNTPISGLRNSVTSERLLQIKERIKNGYRTPIQPSRIKDLLLNEDLSFNSSCDSPGLNTPNKFLDPNMNILPKFDIRDAMATLESPLKQDMTVSSRRSLNLPLEDVYIAKVNQALRYEIETTGGIVPNRSMEDLQEDTPKSMILSDVVIVVSKRLMHLQSELNKLTEQMGGRYRWKYDKACTHFVHQGKASEYNKELRVAQDDGKIIISPEWLFACHQKQMRIAEHLYPYTFNRQLVLDVSTRKEPSPSCSRNDITLMNKFNNSPIKKNPLPISNERKMMNDSINEDKPKSSKIMETAYKQMDEILAVTNVAKDRWTNRITNVGAVNSGETKSSSVSLKSHGIPRKNSTEITDINLIQTLDSGQITWDDPTSRMEQERLAEHLSKDSQSFSQVQDLDRRREHEGYTSMIEATTPKVDHSPVMRFLLAGLRTEDRQKVSEGVKKIGGILLEASHFDPSCTHLIIGLLNRTEKCLSAIASGRWVIRPSYIYDCERAGHILNAEDYEWGSNIEHLPGEQKSFAKATRRWRTQLQSLKSKCPAGAHAKIGAFQDWKVILYTSRERGESFRRLLEAGAAEIVSMSPPFSNVAGVTHAILELSKVQSPNIDLPALLSAGVHCIKPDYIAHFLLEESSSSIRSYYVPEVLPFLDIDEPDSVKRKSDEKDGNSKKTRQR